MGKNYERAYEVLQADKTAFSEPCKALVVKDLERKAGEFFELSSPLELETVKVGGGYRVQITFTAERIKHFQLLK